MDKNQVPLDEAAIRKIVRDEIGKDSPPAVAKKRVPWLVVLCLGTLGVIVAGLYSWMIWDISNPVQKAAFFSKYTEQDFVNLSPGDLLVDKYGNQWEIAKPLYRQDPIGFGDEPQKAIDVFDFRPNQQPRNDYIRPSSILLVDLFKSTNQIIKGGASDKSASQ